ncbi:MAG: DNA repair protein RecO [Actinomycetota bacterium]|nr:DNA repair protein RecO [Actinomycetota bacterium]
MPLYKEQGIVLGAVKLAEADKIVTILTQGSGKIRAVAKGIRRTQSRFGARLEPFTHVDLMLYRGRNLDTVTQVDILGAFRPVRDDFGLFSAGEAMLEVADKVAEEHERNVRLFLLLLHGLRALERRPRDPAAVAEAFLLRLLALSGFAPSLSACAICGSTDVARFSASQGGAVCGGCEERDSRGVDPAALSWLAGLQHGDLADAGQDDHPTGVRNEARALLFGFSEYHLDRRLRSLPLLARASRGVTATPIR